MDPAEPGTAESEWTTENLRKLLTALKACVSKRGKTSIYRTELKTINWNKVMFPPFSAEECQQKWMEIMGRMRKIRSLTELIVEAEDSLSNSGKTCPGLPKKPAPPNAAYFKEKIAMLKKKHPEMTTQQLMQLSSKRFRNLSDKKKARYEKKFILATEEYENQMQKFCEQNPMSRYSVKLCRKKGIKVSADKEDCSNDEEGLPSKPPNSGYLLFCKEQSSSSRAEQTTEKYSVRAWAQQWQDLSPNMKAKYIRLSNELKNEYIINMRSYLNRVGEEKRQQILKENGISLAKMPKLKKVTRLPNEPKMPSASRNVIFCQDQMELMKDKIPNNKERFVKVNQMWKTLSSKEKEQYNKKVKEKMINYTVELQNWFKTLTPQMQEKYERANPKKAQLLKEEKIKAMQMERKHSGLPSDSEDELIEISSDEEENFLTFEDSLEEDSDEDDDGNGFAFEFEHQQPCGV